jgi:ATP-binding cassette subfamily B protein
MASLAFVVKQSPVWLLPIATREIVDAATKGSMAHAIHTIELWSVVAAIAVVQNIPSHTFYSGMISAVNRDIQRDLRSALTIRLQQLSVAFHNEAQAGRLQTKLLRDVDSIGGVLQNLSDLVLSTVVLGTLSLSIAIVQAPMVAVFFLAALPVAAWVTNLFKGRLREGNHKFRREMEGVSIRVNEMIEMLPVTRAHAAESRETSRMRRQLARLTASGRRLDITSNWFGASSWVSVNVFQFSCLVFCATMVLHHKLTVGQLIMFQSFFGMMLGLVSSMLGSLPAITAGSEAIRSIGEILEAPDLEEDDGKPEVETIHGNLRFEHVTFTYPEATRPALTDFSLNIAEGECVALVGESGSGKSTVINLAIGFRKPTSGRILLDGADLNKINLRSVRQRLAIVPQNTLLFSGTVRDNITYGLDGVDDKRLNDVLERSYCAEFVRNLPDGVNTVIGSHGGKLSGGQRQRIAIARALLRDPSMLILDEATSALDAMSEYYVQKAISELIVGRTTIIVAHRLSTLRAANRIVVIKEGKITEEGSWESLLAQKDSAFNTAYEMQSRGAVPV